MYDITKDTEWETWDRLGQAIHTMNQEKGFWPGGITARNVGEALALTHSEISEADEAYFADAPEGELAKDDKLVTLDGFAVELADAAIRVLDLGSAYDVAFDATYGGVEADLFLPVEHDLLACHRLITAALEHHRKKRMELFQVALADLLTYLIETLVKHGYEPLEIIKAKLEYNLSRPFMHGKAY